MSTADNVIVVGACYYNGSKGYSIKCGYSDYGKKNVDLFAMDTTYGYEYDNNTKCRVRATVDGTSISAPRVAGAAAVLLNICPTLTKAQLRHYLLAGVDASTDLADKCVTGGSLNVYKSAKMLISDLAYEWKTVFAGHFTRTDKMQVAAYCQVDKIQMKCYVWTYENGKFSDPEHWFTNNEFAIEYAPYGAFNKYRNVAGDFDGDGYTEICTLYDYDHYLFIEGNGYFVHPVNYKTYLDVHNFTGRVVALDYDNDGKDEIAALYQVPGEWAHTQLYTWDFDGVGTGMVATQRLCYDSGAGNYAANYTTHRVVGGDFDGDGYDELGAIYYYPETGKYSLHKFDIWTGGASYTNLIYKQNNIDATKVTGRVAGCNYNGTAGDEIMCIYDNSGSIPVSMRNQVFYFESSENGWKTSSMYTSPENTFDALNPTHLIVSGYFTADNIEDTAIFYNLPALNPMNRRTRMYICSNAYSYYYCIWDPREAL